MAGVDTEVSEAFPYITPYILEHKIAPFSVIKISTLVLL